ncbi:unnamed protein product [Allacma fusca]|uniref:Uncharacterized protein n=1 Tax=Allacma fusca TaxID=39272 RepID=A0A8J2KQD6_9HEXA|nr:unnamed protein product [Allacma fusca]
MSVVKNNEDGSVHQAITPVDPDFTPPEYLYRIILVCLAIGFILFLIFFALARYLRWQNKQMAILRAQQEREEAQFPFGIDGQLLCPDEPVGDEIPLGIPLQGAVKTCTCNPQGEDACVCQPLNPPDAVLPEEV